MHQLNHESSGHVTWVMMSFRSGIFSCAKSTHPDEMSNDRVFCGCAKFLVSRMMISLERSCSSKNISMLWLENLRDVISAEC